MRGYALDANIVSFYLKKRGAVEQRLKAAEKKEWVVRIPPFAYYEVKRGLLKVRVATRLRELAETCQKYPVGKNDDRVFEEAAEIWADLTRRGRGVAEMDADLRSDLSPPGAG